MDFKEIQKTLKLRMIIGYVYVLLAIYVFLSFFLKLPGIGMEYINDAYLILSILVRLILVITLLVHWIYASFYFPKKYRNYLESIENKMHSQSTPERTDLSNVRGMLAIVLFFFLYSWQKEFNVIAFLLTFSIISAAAILTNTHGLFIKKELALNLELILAKLDGSKNTPFTGSSIYTKVNYLLPKNFNEIEMRELVAEGYCINLQKEKAEEILKKSKDMENKQKITDFSEKIVDKVKS